ncbi:FixH family protein [Piscibacillus salipiscarius]|uniref:FixH family protein n=1 Tax=Piscibacillus salipiscarius TaxID=299480 RepID=UPI0006D03CE7|nr:FixH family protein [Piscibacillus salipiscarius]
MKKIMFITLIMLVSLLTACGGQSEAEQEDNHSEHGENQDKKDDSLIPVVVEILVQDQTELGEQTLQAQVTHDEEPIAEAEEVTFEVWKKGHEDDSEKIETTYTETGFMKQRTHLKKMVRIRCTLM